MICQGRIDSVIAILIGSGLECMPVSAFADMAHTPVRVVVFPAFVYAC